MSQLSLLKQTLGSRVKASIIEAETSFYKINVLKKSFKAAEAHHEFMKTKYNSGDLSEIELFEVENMRNKQEIFYQNSIYDYIIKIARIEKVTGLNITK
jgi:hypothetical protein